MPVLLGVIIIGVLYMVIRDAVKQGVYEALKMYEMEKQGKDK